MPNKPEVSDLAKDITFIETQILPALGIPLPPGEHVKWKLETEGPLRKDVLERLGIALKEVHEVHITGLANEELRDRAVHAIKDSSPDTVIVIDSLSVVCEKMFQGRGNVR